MDGDDVKFMTIEELHAGLDAIRLSPKDAGTLELIVRRPAPGAREILEVGQLDRVEGLVGDRWNSRQESLPVDKQLTMMNSRVIALLAQDRARWQLSGDQLFIDIDLSAENLPPGMRLAVGDNAIIEVTAPPHTGCGKFVQHFGREAAKFVNSSIGRQLRLRGVNARVSASGLIRVGDIVRKLTSVNDSAA